MNKFQSLWCEDVNNTQDYNTFVADSQRKQGFQGGQPASAIRVNTALRQANLVACALMNAIAPNDNTTNYRSSITDVSSLISSSLNKLIKSTKVDNATKADNATKVNNISVISSNNVIKMNDKTVMQSVELMRAGSSYTAYTTDSSKASLTISNIQEDLSNASHIRLKGYTAFGVYDTMPYTNISAFTVDLNLRPLPTGSLKGQGSVMLFAKLTTNSSTTLSVDRLVNVIVKYTNGSLSFTISDSDSRLEFDTNYIIVVDSILNITE